MAQDEVFDWVSRDFIPRWSAKGQILQAIRKSSQDAREFVKSLPPGYTLNPMSNTVIPDDDLVFDDFFKQAWRIFFEYIEPKPIKMGNLYMRRK